MDELATKQSETSPEVTHELLTQICCKLDSVDTHGSEHLRAMRKHALERAQSMDDSLQKAD
jgi:hypothetical protein